jgi:hypothetical protein
MTSPTLPELIEEYDRALAYTDALWLDLPPDEVNWRPTAEFSPIGWHLGHQAAVAHFMVRNLTAAEPSPDPGLDGLMDSATPESARGQLPDAARLAAFRSAVADRVRFRIDNIDRGEVGAPAQLRVIATTMMTAVINHEYQHSQWVGEVRTEHLDHSLPERPKSALLSEIDGYLVIGAAG